MNRGGHQHCCRKVTFRRFYDIKSNYLAKVLSGLEFKKGRWFHICLWFFSNSTIYVVLEAVLAIIWWPFCINAEIFMKATEWDRGNILIAFSVRFHGYKCLQNLIDDFLKSRFLKSVFFMFPMMWFLNSHSEYYNEYVEFPDASINVLEIEIAYDSHLPWTNLMWENLLCKICRANSAV